MPPRPKQIAFPATRILIGLRNREKTPAKTPWWLMLIRLLAAALVIFALADPVMNPNTTSALRGSGPVAIVVDNTWASAAQWSDRMRMVERLIAEAESQSRAVAIVPTAIAGKAPSLRIEPPQAARSSAAALQPQPFTPVRETVGKALQTLMANETETSVLWLTDGIDHDGKTAEFVQTLSTIGRSGFTVVETGQRREALGLAASLGQGGRLEANVLRAGGGARDGVVHAYSNRGQRLGEAAFNLAPGDSRTATTFDLPLELRNQVVRLEIPSERSAGAVHLLDSSSRWHRIGLVSGESIELSQPLLGPLYYIERALAPYSELVKPNDANVATALETVFNRNASVVVLADIGTLPDGLKTKVDQWINKGGVLVRFAGPRLEKGGDDLIPVQLRLGGRTLGGALSWSTPQPLSAFTDDSLFAGLAAPADVTINRQVLADPARLGPNVKVWARLKDGTPLVTALERGQGQIVLFHITANAEWSNLPLSGLFVEMLRRISTLGRIGTATGTTAQATSQTNAENLAAEGDAVLAPQQTLDGFGTLKSPPPTAQAIPASKLAQTQPTATHPPGFYGPQSSPRALNLIAAKTELKPLPPMPSGTERRVFEGQSSTALKPALLAGALGLLFIDIIAVVLLQIGSLAAAGLGNLIGGARRATSSASAVLLAIATAASAAGLGSDPAAAQSDWQFRPLPAPFGGDRPSLFPGRPFLNQPADQLQTVGPSRPPTPLESRAMRATERVTFGYVVTGDPGVDRSSQEGLSGLVKILAYRTAVEAAEPTAVNIDTDEISFYPILYWPVLPNARTLTERTLAKIDAYMKEGGMIVFDTRDYGQGLPSGLSVSGRQDGTPLQRLLGRLDIPRLEPVPDTHVLTKSFYLLRAFPGRWAGGQLWVEAEGAETLNQGGRKARRADGVSSILVTSNDLASAWALDDSNRPIYPVVPGNDRQREMAFRTGVNIVMYALTGNYKADQVHAPALLERLGQ